MIKIVLVLLYIFNGQVVLEQKAYKSKEECHIEGAKRSKEIVSNTKFEQGLFAGCLELKVIEVNEVPSKSSYNTGT